MAFPLSAEENTAIQARIDGQVELVVSAAIRVKGLILSAERPGRHGDLIGLLFRAGLPYEDQGFLTNKGRFVCRKEAAEIALASSQGSPREICKGSLFSEDMWNDGPVAPPAAESGNV